MPDRRFTLWALAAALLFVLWPVTGQAGLGLAAVLVLVSIRHERHRAALLCAANGLAWGSILALAYHLLADHFQLRYVWIYSGAALPTHLKLANIWGGDEGTTLLLAALLVALAARRSTRTAPNQATAWLAAWYLAVAAWLSPFAATPAEWLAEKSAQGMNAHLMNIWMLLHAPMVLLAYAWVLALVAPSLAALSRSVTRWPSSALIDARRAWVWLTAGIGFGMVWAFEDAMYGQFWHWDPVQTAIFAAWCALGAHLHGARGWTTRPGTWRWVPVWSLLAALMVAATMAVTRNEVLASSHRYVGSSTWMAHLLAAGGILIGALVAGWQGRGRGGAQNQPATGRGLSLQVLALRLTQLCFVVLAVCAAAYLAWAFTAAALDLPRPGHLRPFFETLTNWANGSELPLLRAAFAQWDMDGYSAARWMVLPLAALGFVGGWFFTRRVSRAAAWVSLGVVGAAAAWVSLVEGPLTRSYKGTGVLSQSVVHMLPQLDVCLVAGSYLALACLLWTGMRAWRTPKSASYLIPLGVLHAGAVIALWGGLLATAMNAYGQQRIEVGSDWAHVVRGYQLRIADVEVSRGDDGGAWSDQGPYFAMASIELMTPDARQVQGHALYRDSRSAMANDSGPVRQICEILDYRFARYANVSGYVLHPFISRSWMSDTQLWVNPAALINVADGGDAPPVVAVLRVFPFASLLWLGLVLTVAAGAWLAFVPMGHSKEHDR
ncbi:cytochrome c biogenesis protein CcsA [Nitrogeniibacter aestuarii]|uniref:cytochrome c biogenesis protein CcsA n=1 Tax=Nitrogeniibacter aestuarii TaxID=2815343 RepID=UPI001E53601E|nr:cytochrome c biogenesis protein CcsA [Nitrogeniibacter aestuarii]